MNIQSVRPCFRGTYHVPAKISLSDCAHRDERVVYQDGLDRVHKWFGKNHTKVETDKSGNKTYMISHHDDTKAKKKIKNNHVGQFITVMA